MTAPSGQIRVGLVRGDDGDQPCVFCDEPTPWVGMLGIGLVSIRRPICERCVETGKQLGRVVKTRHGKKD